MTYSSEIRRRLLTEFFRLNFSRFQEALDQYMNYRKKRIKLSTKLLIRDIYCFERNPPYKFRSRFIQDEFKDPSKIVLDDQGLEIPYLFVQAYDFSFEASIMRELERIKKR